MDNILLDTQTDWGLNRTEFESVLKQSLEGRNPGKVLLIPPDFTRMHSGAGEIAAFYYKSLKDSCHVDVMPALGTHDPMTDSEINEFFLGEIPAGAVIGHDWRGGIAKLGEVPGSFVNEISEGLMKEPIDIEINRRLLDKSYDLIISIGQVVPHEVAGMANYSKNIFVGCGGSSMINASHMLGAFYGIERVMGVDRSPVRLLFDYAMRFIEDIPLLYILTVTSKPVCPSSAPTGFTPALGGGVVLHGLYAGRERDVYERAVNLSLAKNVINLREKPRKVIVYLEPAEFKSAWLGNKAIYRTRKAISEGGELIIIAPGLKKFGEDIQNDALIRRYGYKGRKYVLEQCEKNLDLRENLSVAAHLIHGSSEGRFEITYAAGGLSREEVEAAGFKYADIEDITGRYNPTELKDGFNTLADGERVYFISNPALGLWIAEEPVYPLSRFEADGSAIWLDIINGEKALIVTEGGVFDRLTGREDESVKAKICPLSHENAVTLRNVFPFTAPVSHHGRAITIGLGDRLGLASPGHIDLIRHYNVFPVLAQQSVRELTLTGRTFSEVLDCATWAVFQEGYTSGYGADGDHLKTVEEVNTALECGYSMITLDCSEHICDISAMDDSEVNKLYNELPADKRADWEAEYLGKTVSLKSGPELTFTQTSLKRDALMYGGAVAHAERIYRECIVRCARQVDFELSIDETPSPTLPASQFFTANELYRHGVILTSLAPRFTGEFQKGIDYLGNPDAFEKDFVAHNSIAQHFGYKISVHSGSDKFSIFPLVGKHAGGAFHLKTAGTNWLEALRVIASNEPAFFRRLFAFALENVWKAKKYYHTTENTANIPQPDSLTDSELPGLLDHPDARQVLHICYGLILQEKRGDEREETLKQRIYTTLRENDSAYREALRSHIGRHLELLGIRD